MSILLLIKPTKRHCFTASTQKTLLIGPTSTVTSTSNDWGHVLLPPQFKDLLDITIQYVTSLGSAIV